MIFAVRASVSGSWRESQSSCGSVHRLDTLLNDSRVISSPQRARSSSASALARVSVQ